MPEIPSSKPIVPFVPNSVKSFWNVQKKLPLLTSNDGLLSKLAYILCTIDKSWLLHWHCSFSDWHFLSQLRFGGLPYEFLVGSYVFLKLYMRATLHSGVVHFGVNYSKVKCCKSKLSNKRSLGRSLLRQKAAKITKEVGRPIGQWLPVICWAILAKKP